MEAYKVFQSESFLLYEGDYKFLVVSKTYNEKDALIIFANVKTRHSVQLHAWMKDNDLWEAYTFGGGRMSVSFKENSIYIQLFGASGDYLFTSKELVEEILKKIEFRNTKYELDLPTQPIKAQITSFKKIIASDLRLHSSNF